MEKVFSNKLIIFIMEIFMKENPTEKDNKKINNFNMLVNLLKGKS